MRTVKLGKDLSTKKKTDIYNFLSALNEINSPMEILLKQDMLAEVKGSCYNLVNDSNSYGYYLSSNTLPKLYELLKRLNCKSFIDLGCGMNLTTNMLYITDCFFAKKLNKKTENSRWYDNTIKFSGIERDKTLIKFSRLFFEDIPVVEADLMSISTKDIKHADVIYMYEPIYNEEMVLSFVDNLVNIMNFNQTILLKSTGPIEDALRNRADIKEIVVKSCPLKVFYKKTASKKVRYLTNS